jgi:hypothetical protein
MSLSAKQQRIHQNILVNCSGAFKRNVISSLKKNYCFVDHNTFFIKKKIVRTVPAGLKSETH